MRVLLFKTLTIFEYLSVQSFTPSRFVVFVHSLLRKYSIICGFLDRTKKCASYDFIPVSPMILPLVALAMDGMPSASDAFDSTGSRSR